MGTGENRAADHIHVLFNGGSDDRVNGATQPGVDHFESFVAQSARQHLGAAVVAVEARLGDQYANRCRALSHGAPRVAPHRDRVRAPAPRVGRRQYAVIHASPRWSSQHQAGVRRARRGRGVRR